jgi:hypothetical protein
MSKATEAQLKAARETSKAIGLPLSQVLAILGLSK